METLVIHSTATAHWQALIHEAEQACNTQLGEELQSYLVFLLMRYTNAAELAGSVLALDFLDSMETVGRLRQERLWEVGDKCLLYSGLFPGRAERRRVNISYYVNLGVGAYGALSHLLSGVKAKIFQELSEHFVGLMDVLQSTRELSSNAPTLQPLQAMELWNDTGSVHAFTTLSRYTQAIPVRIAQTQAKPHYRLGRENCASNIH